MGCNSGGEFYLITSFLAIYMTPYDFCQPRDVAQNGPQDQANNHGISSVKDFLLVWQLPAVFLTDTPNVLISL